MEDLNMTPISCSQLASKLDNGAKLLLVDTRPSAQHCSKHIRASENVNFSNILLRRLLKGVVLLGSLLPSKDLARRLAGRDSEEEMLVVYDSSSKSDSIRTELCKHAQVLARTDLGKNSDATVYFLDGGLEKLSVDYPHLCVASSMAAKKPHSPLGISVSASLPIFGGQQQGRCKKQYSKLQTPSEDSASQFGPPVEILPHLVLGCAKDSGNLTQLRRRGVTAVLNVSHNCPNHFESLLEYKCIPVQDSYQADLLSKMETAIEYIDSIKEKNGCTFVHCHAGISRSATICIAYIMKKMNMDLAKAYEFVKEKRPCISPNLHFMGQLLEFQKQLQENQGSDATDGKDEMALSSTPVSGCHAMTGTGMYYAVSMYDSVSPLQEADSDCEESSHCSSDSSVVLQPTTSAPSSLNFDNTNTSSSQSQEEPMEIGSTQVTVTTTTTEVCHRAIKKPKTLPLRKSISVQEKPSERQPIEHRFISIGSGVGPERLISSISLPTTPILSQYRNHLRLCRTPSPLPYPKPPHPLQQHSPCRVEASLGSRSETCLNYFNHTPIAESN